MSFHTVQNRYKLSEQEMRTLLIMMDYPMEERESPRDPAKIGLEELETLSEEQCCAMYDLYIELGIEDEDGEDDVTMRGTHLYRLVKN